MIPLSPEIKEFVALQKRTKRQFGMSKISDSLYERFQEVFAALETLLKEAQNEATDVNEEKSDG